MAGHHFLRENIGDVLRTLCVRPVRSKPLARVGAERRRSFDLRNCISMQVNDTAEAVSQQSRRLAGQLLPPR